MNMRKYLLNIAVSLALVVTCYAAQEAKPISSTTVSFTVSGTVSASNFTAIPVGSKFSTAIKYDPTTTGTLYPPGFTLYNLPSSGVLKVASSQISWSTVRCSVQDEFDTSSAGTGPWEDFFDWVSGVGPLAFSGGLKKELGATSCRTCIDYVRVFFASVSTTQPVPPLASNDLPNPFPKLKEWLNGGILQVGAFNSATGQNLLAQGTVATIKVNLGDAKE